MVLAEQSALRVMSGEHDRFKHYVLAIELRQSLRAGVPVVALCGKKWRPDADPSRYPLCPTCAEAYGEDGQ